MNHRKVLYSDSLVNMINAQYQWIYLFVDYSKGFGGKYGVQKDRVDKVKNNFIFYLIFQT